MDIIKRITKKKLKEIIPKNVEIIGTKNLFENDYETWKKLRSLGIGGSDVGAILGRNNYTKPINVYLGKLGEDTPFEGNYKTQYGHWQEPSISDRFEEKHSDTYDVYECGYTFKHGYLVANVDRILYDKVNDRWGILEIKTGGEKTERNWELGEVGEDPYYTFEVLKSPDSYYAQTQHYLETLQFDFAVLVGTLGQKYVESKPYPRNPAEGKFIRDLATQFFENHVIPRVPPVADGTDNYKDFLVKEFPVDDIKEGSVYLDDETESYVEKYVRLSQKISTIKSNTKELEKELNTYKQLIILNLEGHGIGEADRYKVIRGGYKRSSFNEKEFKNDIKVLKDKYPEVLEEGIIKDNYKTKTTEIIQIKIEEK